MHPGRYRKSRSHEKHPLHKASPRLEVFKRAVKDSVFAFAMMHRMTGLVPVGPSLFYCVFADIVFAEAVGDHSVISIPRCSNPITY